MSLVNCSVSEVNQVPNTCKILIGPIIGKISHNSIRILLELNQDIDLKCILMDLSTKIEIQYIIKCKRNIPKGFNLENLDEDTEYEFSIIDERIINKKKKIKEILTDKLGEKNKKINLNEKSNETKIGKKCIKIKTLSRQPVNFNIASVYGNETREKIASLPSKITEYLGLYNAEQFIWDTKDNLWISILNNKNIHCIIHLGNQVNLYKTLEDFIKNITKKDKELYTKLGREDQKKYFFKIFQAQYRINWNKKYLKEVLSSRQNIMIAGREDIFYPDKKYTEICKKEGIICNLTEIAYEIYYMYQRQLDSEIDLTKEIQEYHSHVWGKYGIFLTDILSNKIIKTNNMYIYNGNEELISKKQQKEMKEFVYSKKVEVCFFTFEQSLVNNIPYTTKTISETSKRNIELNRWPVTETRLYTIFQHIMNWKTDPVNKNIRIALISGNYGFNNPSKIRIVNTDTNKSMMQISTGNITGWCNKKKDSIIFLKYKKWDIDIKYENKNNYGLILNRYEIDVSTRKMTIHTEMKTITSVDNINKNSIDNKIIDNKHKIEKKTKNVENTKDIESISKTILTPLNKSEKKKTNENTNTNEITNENTNAIENTNTNETDDNISKKYKKEVGNKNEYEEILKLLSEVDSIVYENDISNKVKKNSEKNKKYTKKYSQLTELEEILNDNN